MKPRERRSIPITNKEHYFSSDERIAATLKQISLCCNETLCEACPIQEVCCQDPIAFFEWLQRPCACAD